MNEDSKEINYSNINSQSNLSYGNSMKTVMSKVKTMKRKETKKLNGILINNLSILSGFLHIHV